MAKRSPITQTGRSKLAPGSRLAPEVVRSSQRERLMIALVEVVDRQGLPATTVAHLTERAHVSRAAFYEQFDSLRDCFLTTCDTHTARVLARVLPAYETPTLSWPQRLEAAMDALAAGIQTWPAAARVCVSDILTAGSPAGERNEQAIALVGQMLRDGRATADGRSAADDPATVSEQAAVAVAGGIRRVIHDGLRESRKARPPDLAPELLGWLLACVPLAVTAGEPASIDARGDGNARGDGDEGQAGDKGRDGDERRERILAAVTELASTKGYEAMSHRDIAGLAKVSYSTFYNQFENKQKALLAACEVAHERLAQEIAPALAAAPDWPQGVSAAIAAYLRAAAESPREARLLGLEIYSLGHPGLELLDRQAGDFERLLDPGYELSPQTSRTAAVAFAGAMLELLRHHASAQRISELPVAGPELSHIALAPFLGPEEAQRIARLHPGRPVAA